MNGTNIKIATLNLCLGIRNKKDEVKRLITENRIDILCIQETELPFDYPFELLTFSGFKYENEINDVKARCGIYLSNQVSYVRRLDIERKNLHVIVIDLNDPARTRIINVYRTFSPQTNQTQKEHFMAQVALISSIITKNTIILGDFNLDHKKRFDINYSHKNYFIILNQMITDHHLSQIVNFNTGSRVINNIHHSSLIDHIYVNSAVNTLNLASYTPPFGDHLLITFTVNSKLTNPKCIIKRNWKSYSKDKLINSLSQKDWNIENDDVHGFWNNFKSNLIKIVDNLCPITETIRKPHSISNPPSHIKRKMNRRNNQIKKLKSPTINITDTRMEIKTLNKEIKHYFYQHKGNTIRKNILPGNSKTLWDAVKTAKDINQSSLPEEMFFNQIKVDPNNLPSVFGTFFLNKVKSITDNININPNVYNGIRKVNEASLFYVWYRDNGSNENNQNKEQ